MRRRQFFAPTSRTDGGTRRGEGKWLVTGEGGEGGRRGRRGGVIRQHHDVLSIAVFLNRNRRRGRG